MSKLKDRFEEIKKDLKEFKNKKILPVWYSLEASLIKIKFISKKRIKPLMLSVAWIIFSISFIFGFAWVFKKTNSIEVLKNESISENIVSKAPLSDSDYVFFSATAYFTGSYYDKVPVRKVGRAFFILECSISFFLNGIFIGLLIYFLLKSEKTILFSKYIYITMKDNKIILRTRIADYLNSYVNHNYVIEFYYWNNNDFRTTYLTVKYDIAEMAYVFNTWTILKEIDKSREDSDAKIVDFFAYLFKKMDEAADQKKRYFLCVILSGSNKGNGEPVVIKEYYKLDHIKFCDDCNHVFKWKEKYPFVTKRIWGNLNRFTPMKPEQVEKIKNDFKDKAEDIKVLYEWDLSNKRAVIS